MNQEDIRKAIHAYIYLNKDKIINEVIEEFDYTLAYTKDSNEEWWNYAFLKDVISDLDVKKVESFFESRGKKPSFYFLSGTKFDDLKNLLICRGYELFLRDDWLFWDKGKVDGDFGDINIVSTDKDFDLWLETYLKSYGADDPKNPYGDQSEFAGILRNLWYGKKFTNEKFYIAFDRDGKAVAVGLLTSFNDIGEISSVGSVPSVRGMGYGKKITHHIVNESINSENKMHYLTTEKGEHPYEFYNRIGFKKKFSMLLYSKKV